MAHVVISSAKYLGLNRGLCTGYRFVWRLLPWGLWGSFCQVLWVIAGLSWAVVVTAELGCSIGLYFGALGIVLEGLRWYRSKAI